MAYHVPGPCTIQFDSNDLGTTKSGIIIRVNTALVPITDDPRGAVPGTYLFGGKSATVEVVCLQPALLQTANIWDGGTLLQTNQVGKLASATGKQLKIIEADTNNTWIADLAFPTDPNELRFVSTQELQIPIQFVIVNNAGKLFSTVPSYI